MHVELVVLKADHDQAADVAECVVAPEDRGALVHMVAKPGRFGDVERYFFEQDCGSNRVQMPVAQCQSDQAGRVDLVDKCANARQNLVWESDQRGRHSCDQEEGVEQEVCETPKINRLMYCGR